ncbi:MAG: hypothetical protein OEQ18_15455 [Gammaproteobacteria bacterium]|nr:hypothetical protein [Gammaproteobacteria bacterium]
MSINIPCLVKTVVCVCLLSGCAGSTSKNYSRQDSESKLAHCEELRKRIDELKGKPQRRKAASDRYDLECRQR